MIGDLESCNVMSDGLCTAHNQDGRLCRKQAVDEWDLLRLAHEDLRNARHEEELKCAKLAGERERLLLQNGELREALDRDKTGLAAALAKIREEVKGRRWICEGRGPYTYDDDRYRKETGFALDAIEKLAVDALADSGKLAHEALTDKREGRS